MNRTIITGGAGFIGSHIAEELSKEAKNQVVVIDDLSSGRRSNLDALKGKAEFHEADIRDYDRLRRLFSGVDYVFHEAALVSVFDSVKRPEESYAINMTGTLNVLRAARENGIKRVVLASSAAVYGNDPVLPKKETLLPRPESPYALAKIANEYHARVYSRLYGLPVISLRYFNVYGPRQDPSSPYSGVISIFADRILEGKAPLIYGDGKQSRDFVFVADVVRANCLAMRDPALKGGEVFNVATGRATDLLSLLEKMNSIEGTSLSPRFTAQRAGDIKESLADIGHARRVLGYSPSYTLEEGLSRLMASLKPAEPVALSSYSSHTG